MVYSKTVLKSTAHLTVTFFGHKDAPISIQNHLINILTDLIEHKGANIFYVGNHGNFDRLVQAVLSQLESKYPHIRYFIVLAYMPRQTDSTRQSDQSHTIFPYEMATAIPKFAISKRNQWMLQKSDVVVTYVTHSYGGAATFKQLAISRKKQIIELAE